MTGPASSNPSAQSSPAAVPPWTGMIAIDDTALAASDTGGTGRPVVYLNGSFAARRSWRRVVTELGPTWRHLTYDERARGRSKRSADYSFAGCLRDVDAVLNARGVERPLLVGWSYGAAVAVHWAAANPDRVAGVVLVDGGIPWGLTGEENRERIRRIFHKMRVFLPLARPFGLAASMSAAQHAMINIEINEVCADLEPVLERMACPARWVLASGANLGGEAGEMEQMRTTLDPLLRRRPNFRVSAKVASNHTQILRKDSRAVAAAVRDVAEASGPGQVR